MTTQIAPTTVENTNRSTRRPLLLVAPLAMAASAAANLGLYAIAGRLFPSVSAWSGAGPGQIVGASIAYLFLGTLVFAALRRLSPSPARHYRIVATLGLLLSLALPIGAAFGAGAPGAPPAGLATVLTLSLMHVVAYAISVPLFIRQALA